MPRTIRFSCLIPARSFVSALALATAAFALPATAQNEQPDVSQDFVQAYTPVQQVVNAPDGDIRSVVAQFDAIARIADTADEKNYTGQLMYSAGQKLEDRPLLIRGLQLQLDSGKFAPEMLPQGYWTLGSLAYEVQNWQLARQALTQAAQVGYTTNEVAPMIAEAAWELGDIQAGIDILTRRIGEMTAAGQQVPQSWLLRGLQVAYNNNLPQAVAPFAEPLVTQHASQRSWMGALQVINAIGGLNNESRLDLLRLMRETDALSQEAEYRYYIDAADPRVRPSEINSLLAEGVAAGHLDANSEFHNAVKETLEPRLASERSEAMAEVESAPRDRTGQSAKIAGDLLFSLGDYAEAEDMYRMALDMGDFATPVVLTRLGIAQFRQGKMAEAKATLERVDGNAQIVARMWSAYIGNQSA